MAGKPKVNVTAAVVAKPDVAATTEEKIVLRKEYVEALKRRLQLVKAPKQP